MWAECWHWVKVLKNIKELTKKNIFRQDSNSRHLRERFLTCALTDWAIVTCSKTLAYKPLHWGWQQKCPFNQLRKCQLNQLNLCFTNSDVSSIMVIFVCAIPYRQMQLPKSPQTNHLNFSTFYKNQRRRKKRSRSDLSQRTVIIGTRIIAASVCVYVINIFQLTTINPRGGSDAKRVRVTQTHSVEFVPIPTPVGGKRTRN